MQKTRGFSIVELVVALVCLAVIVVILASLSPRRGRPQQLIDASQMRGIHQSWLVFAHDNDGIRPTPGLVDRLPVNGVDVPGKGDEDVSQNTTANVFSVCVMQNFFAPELCISPTEPSAHVKAFDADSYRWDQYAPASGFCWDPKFMADLANVSHVSYAHMPLFGKRRELHWRDTMNAAAFPIIGNRGPLNGVHDPKSITNRIHPPNDTWNGNVCFADNHIDGLLSTFTPPGITFNRDGKDVPDNIFAIEDGPAGADAILTFTKKMTESGPESQHD